MLRVICVLKSGGDYNAGYVEKLGNMVRRHLSVPFLFLPMTDEHYCGKPGLLVKGWPGWWSKIEIFRIAGPCIYIDLDTVILGSLDKLAGAVMGAREDCFYMLRKFINRAGMNSGIMAWRGDWKWLYDEFNIENCPKYHRGDQDYIYYKLQQKGVAIHTVNEHLSGIYSYKHQCRNKLPNDACIVYFHGHPRPHQVKAGWLNEHWK